jgi:hypothetical protein
MADSITLQDIALVAAVNDDTTLESNLLRSPMLCSNHVNVLLQRGFKSASAAYNAAMRQSDRSIMIFAHQDVYIPDGWERRLFAAIGCIGDDWAVLGIIGKDEDGQVGGRTWSTGIQKEVGVAMDTPRRAAGIDELLIVINMRSKITFDEGLCGYHLYGTDIVQIALNQGLGAYIIEAPVIHNSLPLVGVDPLFEQGYAYLQKKWKKKLPLDHLIVPITRWGWPLRKYKIRQRIKKRRNRAQYSRLPDPRAKSKELGYE